MHRTYRESEGTPTAGDPGRKKVIMTDPLSFWQIQQQILDSSEDDWHHIGCWGGGGPSFRESSDGRFYHHMVAAYMPDPRLTLAWGVNIDGDDSSMERRTSWSEDFPDPKMTAHYCDVFWCGSLIERVAYYNVDGGRHMVPEFNGDEDGPKTVKPFPHALIRLIAHLELPRPEWKYTLERVGITAPEGL